MNGNEDGDGAGTGRKRERERGWRPVDEQRMGTRAGAGVETRAVAEMGTGMMMGMGTSMGTKTGTKTGSGRAEKR